MKYFYLQRVEDVSGTSGIGRVAEGVEFSSGQCCLKWLTNVSSIAIYDSIKDVEAIHGHEGKTKVIVQYDIKFY